VYNYEKDGAEIYRQSFATVRREADLARFSHVEAELVIRLIHACGMVDLAKDVVISPSALEAGRKALAAGAEIICDVHMVEQGIIRRNLPKNNALLCNVRASDARMIAERLGTPRSAAGLESLKGHIAGAIIVIGNAPTALFHLLEMLDRGIEPPALIIGCPVGFVGAVESKEALIAHSGSVPFITVRGRRGGSAMAAAAVNALCSGLKS
jgi:precorrin isomerase